MNLYNPTALSNSCCHTGNGRAIISLHFIGLNFFKSALNKIMDEHVNFHTSSKIFEEKDQQHQQAEMRCICRNRMAWVCICFYCVPIQAKIFCRIPFWHNFKHLCQQLLGKKVKGNYYILFDFLFAI